MQANTKLSVPRYLARHDVVYKTPALKGHEGLPVGNGRAGGLVYHGEKTIEMHLNHTDAVDYAPDGPMRAWAWESEEKNTAPFSPGHLRIQSALPLFSWPYLSEYEERLSLGDAAVTCRAVTPFAKLAYKLYAAQDPEVFVLEFDLCQQTAAGLVIELERFGTANFFHHYEQVVRVFDRNLAGTAAQVPRDGGIAITHAARGSASAVAARLVEGDAVAEEISGMGCALRFAPAKHIKFTLHFAVQAAETAKAALAAARETLQAAAGRESGRLWAAHQKDWAGFWNRSYVHIEGEDYLENVYYMHLYALRCCTRGKNPPLFGGVFTPFGDSRNWGHFYHWNHQQTVWGLYAAGHAGLCENYLGYRWRMFENAARDAEEWFGSKGVFYSDISNLNGFNAPEEDTLRNLTVGAQIAMDFYRHWQYTGDEAFLARRAAPMLRAAMEFYAGLLEKQPDGRWRVKGGATDYESYWVLRETLTDFAAIHALVNALSALPETLRPDEETMALYLDMARNLYELPTTTTEHGGETLPIFADGVTMEGETVEYAQGVYPMSPFPATLCAMVYPSGLVGLSQKGSEWFTLAQNTARVLFDREVYQAGPLGLSGHSPTPQMAARLGMGGDVLPILRHFAKTYGVFPNGLMHFADIRSGQQWSRMDNPRILPPGIDHTKYDEIHNKALGPRTKIDSEYFLHPYFEAPACIADGLGEALLQSYDGVIRVFPAMEADATFCLYAVGGVRVEAAQRDGRVRYVCLQAACDTVATLQNPWPGEAIGGGPDAMAENGGSLAVPLAAGVPCVLYPEAEGPPEGRDLPESEPNQAPKHFGGVSIGLDPILNL